MTCRLALAVPGTTPDYWATVDDRLTATMLAVLDDRAAPARPAPGARPRRR